MTQRQELLELVVQNLEELGEQEDVELPEDLGAETAIFGDGGVLDSMSLVSLIVAVEQAVEERYGEPISLADEKALSRRSSPYRTIGSLVDYAVEVISSG